MGGRENKKTVEKRPVPSVEIRLNARAVSRGIAIGNVIWLHGTNHQFYKVKISPSEVANELERLRRAIDAAKHQLSRLTAGNGKGPKSGVGIFETHLALIADSSLPAKFEAEIKSRHVNAEWAIKKVSDAYVAKYKSISDETLRDRHIDIEDISERILSALDGRRLTALPFAKDSIIVARELRPSTLIELSGGLPRAIITETGGWTSHTFIIAREMKLPAVTGLQKDIRRLKTGDRVIVDGFAGQVIIHPDSETVKGYLPAAEAKTGEGHGEEAADDGRLRTLDGHSVNIYANADTPASYQRAAASGAVGIGLYRSEFLFDQHRGLPTEADQRRAYESIGDTAMEGGVKIRTFDLSVDRLPDQGSTREKNPALGLRAVRLGLAHRSIQRTQLRALLRASYNRNIDIVVPMVSGVSEIREIRKTMSEEADKLKTAKKDVGSPRVGAMIEIPSAVVMIDEIIEETDFICLGTNDLIQYLLAADRDNEAVAGWYRSLHPAVLKAVRHVIEAARKADKQAIVCGEMAGSPYYVPVLIGLGATDLSMNASSMPHVRKVIGGIAAEECTRLVKGFEGIRSVEEVEELAERYIRTSWKHLFPPDFSFSS